MMHRLILTIILFYPCILLAQSTYQIDLILFAQPTNAELNTEIPLISINQTNAITLKTTAEKTAKPYKILPNSYSTLKDQYYLLSRKSHYPVLGHYSWQQPANNRSKVFLPLSEHNGWQLQGTFQISQNAYYSFNADLQVSAPNNPLSSYNVSYKQRLKENIIYYLDNDRIGMVVKIHKL